MSSHATMPQSLYGKIQIMASLSGVAGGIDAEGIVVHRRLNWGFALDFLYEGQTPTPMIVTCLGAVMRKWLVGFPMVAGQDALGVLVDGAVSVFPAVAYLPVKGSGVYQNIEWSKVLGEWYSFEKSVLTASFTMFAGSSKQYGWTNKDYPFLPSTTGSGTCIVHVSPDKILTSDAYEYDISDGGLTTGLGGNIVVVIGGGSSAPTVTGSTIRLKRNAWVSITLEVDDTVTGVVGLPSTMQANVDVKRIEGYMLESGPISVEVSLLGGRKFILKLESYMMERRMV